LKAALLTLSLLFPVAATAATSSFIPIAKARQQAQGTTVTVIGLVTVPSGDFSSSSGDEGFAIQDQTGGIWVSVTKNPRLAIGQKVRVSGVLGNSYAKLQIVPGNVEKLEGRRLRVATGEVGPAVMGSIITIEGTITAQGVQKDETYGWKLWLDDGSGQAQVYLNRSTDIDAHAPYLKAGRKLRVTGFGNQYDTAYEVDPRSKRDLEPR
jgi:hypothetical protein